MNASLQQARFLGLDLGTSSLKVLVADEQGVPLTVVSRRYPLLRPRESWAEQDPEDWWAALVGALEDLRAAGISLEALGAIGLSGQMHGLVLLDAHGEAIGRCQTWADSRCERETRAFERRMDRDRLLRIAGSHAYTSATAPKLLWTRRHEPECLRAAAHLLLPKDYLRYRLTGVLATDASDASGTLLCDVAARDWSPELIEAAAVRHSLLPPVVEATAVIGTVGETAGRALGLPPGVPVVAGGGDAACAGVGQGLVGEAADAGLGLATLGTAGQFFAAAKVPIMAPDGAFQTLCHAVPGRWFVMRAILAGGSAMEWLVGIRAPGMPDDERAKMLHSLLASAADEPPGARGLLFLPHLNGVRSPRMESAASGALIGLRPDTTTAQMARAVIEGVALALGEGLEAMRAAGIPVERVRLAGGANQRAPWPEVQASAYGLPVEGGAAVNASALGAAWLAAAGVGALRLEDLAARAAATAGEVTLPNDGVTVTYRRLSRLAREAGRRLCGTFNALERGGH